LVALLLGALVQRIGARGAQGRITRTSCP
jgi:hypothetical protein